MGGRGLLYGTGPIYNTEARTPDNFVYPVENGDFGPFATGYFDFVGLGSIGADINAELTTKAAKYVKTGGHLILALTFKDPSTALSSINETVSRAGYWLAKDQFVKDDIVFAVFKRLRGSFGLKRNPTTKQPRACVSRLGAIGDMIMVTPLLHKLKDEGYHVTVNCSKGSAPVLKNNPHVDNIVVQVRNIVPNHELGDYWKEWAKHYDKYINLSESIEGRLLKVEGRRTFYTTKEWRHETCNVNYYDATLAVGLPDAEGGKVGEIFLNAKERAVARRLLPKGTVNIAVALTGTSHHKYYPLLGPILGEWLGKHPEARVVLLGDKRASQVAFVHPQVVDLTNKTSLREAFAVVEQAALVIGPETALTNAAAALGTPVVVFLSHSTQENLTKYWKNCVALEPEGCPCWPCHQLHYTEESCPLAEVKDETGEVIASGPICAMGSVPPEKIWGAIDELLAR